MSKQVDQQLVGGKVNYYLVRVENPQREEQPPYQAECEDIIRALNMTFAEGCEFKAIWRTAAARLGNGKPGHQALYDAQKRLHYAAQDVAAYMQTQKPTKKPNDWVSWKFGDPIPESNNDIQVKLSGEHISYLMGSPDIFYWEKGSAITAWRYVE